MNKNYYETLDENFEQALKFYENDYSESELFEFLRSGNIVQKQIAALKLQRISSADEAKILVSNLTGQDGKIREVVSLRLNEFMNDERFLTYFQNIENYDVFLEAITDINANICRNVIKAVLNLKKNDEFCNHFCPLLAKTTLELLDIVEKFDFQDGKYKVNKEAFKLYWCLETIYEFWDKLDFGKLKEIILRSSEIGEYTIREKAAKILTRDFQDEELLAVKNKLKKDSNYYVRRF